MYRLLGLKSHNGERERSLMFDFPCVSASLAATIGVEVKRTTGLSPGRRRRRNIRWGRGRRVLTLESQSAGTAESGIGQ
jgi:hypothetical protein